MSGKEKNIELIEAAAQAPQFAPAYLYGRVPSSAGNLWPLSNPRLSNIEFMR
jgi:hypothetical protein